MANNHAFLPTWRGLSQTRWDVALLKCPPCRIDCRRGAVRGWWKVLASQAQLKIFQNFGGATRLIWNSPDLTVQTVRVDRP